MRRSGSDVTDEFHLICADYDWPRPGRGRFAADGFLDEMFEGVDNCVERLTTFDSTDSYGLSPNQSCAILLLGTQKNIGYFMCAVVPAAYTTLGGVVFPGRRALPFFLPSRSVRRRDVDTSSGPF